jgi:signal transduction histidine kinase
VSAVRDGDALVLRVADNGPGIPAEERERVLQRFVRLEKSRSQAGSGLGLSLVAAVVRLHNGTIELGDGDPGLVVTIRLPVG